MLIAIYRSWIYIYLCHKRCRQFRGVLDTTLW